MLRLVKGLLLFFMGTVWSLSALSPVVAQEGKESLITFAVLKTNTDLPSMGMSGGGLMNQFMKQAEQAMVHEEGGEELLAEIKQQGQELEDIIRKEFLSRELTDLSGTEESKADIRVTVIPAWVMDSEGNRVDHWMFDYRTINGRTARLPFKNKEQLVTLINTQFPL